ncbi:MAG: hypothetical protein RLZZ401_1257 [Pseudomonadota bacterium]|jgi:putative oxidoreductase
MNRYPSPHLSTPARVLGSAQLAWAWLIKGLIWLQSPALLAARIYVGYAFWLSGLTKVRDWETTLALFENEYSVPLLSPTLAAYLGTAGEIVLPILLVLGLGGRFAALGLTVLNAVAVASLMELAPVAAQQHLFWGALLGTVALFGPGAWALERWLGPRLGALCHQLASRSGVAPI